MVIFCCFCFHWSYSVPFPVAYSAHGQFTSTKRTLSSPPIKPSISLLLRIRRTVTFALLRMTNYSSDKAWSTLKLQNFLVAPSIVEMKPSTRNDAVRAANVNWRGSTSSSGNFLGSTRVIKTRKTFWNSLDIFCLGKQFCGEEGTSHSSISPQTLVGRPLLWSFFIKTWWAIQLTYYWEALCFICFVFWFG